MVNVIDTKAKYSIDDEDSESEEDDGEECPDCGDTLQDMNQLADHFMSHHQNNQSPAQLKTYQPKLIAKQDGKIFSGASSVNNLVPNIAYVAEKMPSVQKMKAPIAPSTKAVVNEETPNVKPDPENSVAKDTEVGTNLASDINEEPLEDIDTYENMLARYIQENDLPFIPRFRNRSDGNCWYEAIADQVVLHKVPNLPTDHAALRKAVCDALLTLPQAKAWVKHLFGGKKAKFVAFIDKHRKDGQWTDAKGLMCQATALLVKRNIHIVGTANMDQKVCYTKLESVSEADKMPPMNVGYYQNKHYQSLEKIGLDLDDGSKIQDKAETVNDKEVLDKISTTNVKSDEKKDESSDKLATPVVPVKIMGKTARKPIAAKPLRRSKAISSIKEDDDHEIKVPVLSSNNILPKVYLITKTDTTDTLEKVLKNVDNFSTPVKNLIHTPTKLKTTVTPSGNVPKTSSSSKVLPKANSSVPTNLSVERKRIHEKKKITTDNLSKPQDNLKVLNLQKTSSPNVEAVMKLDAMNSLEKVKKLMKNDNEASLKNVMNKSIEAPLKSMTPLRKIPRVPIASQALRKPNLPMNSKFDNNFKIAKKIPKSIGKNESTTTMIEAVKPPNLKELENKNVSSRENIANLAVHEKKPLTQNMKNESIENNWQLLMDKVMKDKSEKITKRAQSENKVKENHGASMENIKSFKISKKVLTDKSEISVKPNVATKANLIKSEDETVVKNLKTKHKSQKINSAQMSLINRRKLINDAAIKIQRWFRHQYKGVIARKNFIKKRKAALRIQTQWRYFIARRKYKKTKAVIMLQRKWRSFMVRRYFLRTKKAAGTIQKMFRRTRDGKVIRREFLRKKRAVITLQTHWRSRMAELNSPCFQLLAPDEHYINPETGELQLVNDFIINPETGELEKSVVNLELYVTRLNRFLDFHSLRKMSVRSWKNSRINDNLGTVFRDGSSEIESVHDSDNTEMKKDHFVGANDKQIFDISMKPSKTFNNNNGKRTRTPKWKKPDLEETFFTGILPEISHWKIPFNIIQNEKVEECKDFVDTSVDEDFIFNASLNSHPASLDDFIPKSEESYSTPKKYESASFTKLRGKENKKEEVSWLEQSIEAKSELIRKSAIILQSAWRGFIARRNLESIQIARSIVNVMLSNATFPREVALDIFNDVLDNVLKKRTSARASKRRVRSYLENPLESENIESTSSSKLLFSTFHTTPTSGSPEKENSKMLAEKEDNKRLLLLRNKWDLEVLDVKESSKKKVNVAVVDIDESDDAVIGIDDDNDVSLIEISENPQRKRRAKSFTDNESPYNNKRTRTVSDYVSIIEKEQHSFKKKRKRRSQPENIYIEDSEDDEDLDNIYTEKKKKINSSVLETSSSKSFVPKCFKCNFETGSSNLKNHILSHYYSAFYDVCPNEKPFCCPECGKPSRDRITTIRHFAYSHGMIYKYTDVTPEKLRTR